MGRETLAQDVDGIQQRFYGLGAEIARLEESLRAKEQRGASLLEIEPVPRPEGGNG